MKYEVLVQEGDGGFLFPVATTDNLALAIAMTKSVREIQAAAGRTIHDICIHDRSKSKNEAGRFMRENGEAVL